MEKLIFIGVCVICGIAVAAAQMFRMDKGGGQSRGANKNAAGISRMNQAQGKPGLREQLDESKKRIREHKD